MKRWIIISCINLFIGTASFLNAQTIEWERTISLPNDQSFIAIAEADSGFFGYGQGEDPTDFNELLKLDTIGNLLWRKPLGIGPITSVSGDMVKVPGEFTYYLSGFYSQGGFGNDFIAKVDTRGDTLWVYRYAASAIYQTWYKLAVLKDKSVLSIGYQSQPGTNEDIFVRRLDSLGNLMWEEIYPIPGDQRAYDIVEMLDGSLIITGISDGDNLIMRIGFDGRLVYQLIQNTGGNAFSIFGSLLQNNKILQTGIPSSPSGSWQNFNIFQDSTYQVLQQIGFTTTKAYIDEDSNAVIRYFDGSNVRMRYTYSKVVSNIWDIDLGQVSGDFKAPSGFYGTNGGAIIAYGYSDSLNNQNYWLAKISGVGEEWIPDRCSFQPPIAGFDYEYNYPILTLRDTSSGGLKYLDTVYTWQWNTSVGTNGTDDSLVVFFDTAITKTIDFELVIGNWYGCTDTVNQTLVLGKTGLEVYKELEVKVFPNPVKDILNVQIESSDDFVFRLYDLQGKVRMEKTLVNSHSVISLSSLPKGLYFYEVKNGDKWLPISIGRGKVVKK